MFTSSLLVAVSFLSAPGDVAASSLGSANPPAAPARFAARSVPNPSASKLRSYQDYTAAAENALRAESSSRSFAERAAATHTLCELYTELTRDARLEKSETLTDLVNLIGVRLRHVKDDLVKTSSSPNAVSSEPRARSESSLALASTTTLQSAARQASGHRGGGIVDAGQDLVDLIEATISPSSWDVNGGKSTIIYYAPLRVLVVSAPEEVHGNTGGLLAGLRAAGQ